jgi:5'-3' exonuclease
VFYTQLLTGDPGDGVKGASGIGKVKAEKILRDLTTEQEMYTTCLDYFSCEEELEMNAQVLWIWREPMGIWRKPSFETSIE